MKTNYDGVYPDQKPENTRCNRCGFLVCQCDVSVIPTPSPDAWLSDEKLKQEVAKLTFEYEHGVETWDRVTRPYYYRQLAFAEEIVTLCRRNCEPLIKAKVLKEVDNYLVSQCTNPKHKNCGYAKTDCHECIDEMTEQLRQGQMPNKEQKAKKYTGGNQMTDESNDNVILKYSCDRCGDDYEEK